MKTTFCIIILATGTFLLAFRIQKLEARNAELTSQLVAISHRHGELVNQVIDLSNLVGDTGDELTNLENKLHIDRESVQD